MTTNREPAEWLTRMSDHYSPFGSRPPTSRAHIQIIEGPPVQQRGRAPSVTQAWGPPADGLLRPFRAVRALLTS